MVNKAVRYLVIVSFLIVSCVNSEAELFDELTRELWEADGGIGYGRLSDEQTLTYYGGLFASASVSCEIDYVELYDLVVEKAEKLLVDRLTILHKLREYKNSEECTWYFSL